MNKQKKTKIVATLGPASSDIGVMEQLIKEGVDVFRINFSHADYEGVRERIKNIRQLNEKLGTHTSILADLQGPKLRVGEMKEGSVVKEGDTVTSKTQSSKLTS